LQAMMRLLIDETDATLESLNGELLPTDRQRVHLAKAAIVATIPHAQVAYAELARVEDDHEGRQWRGRTRTFYKGLTGTLATLPCLSV
jgi:hypothetical protein